MGFVKRSEKLFLGLSVNFGGLRKSPIKSRLSRCPLGSSGLDFYNPDSVLLHRITRRHE